VGCCLDWLSEPGGGGVSAGQDAAVRGWSQQGGGPGSIVCWESRRPAPAVCSSSDTVPRIVLQSLPARPQGQRFVLLNYTTI